jgi:hypothetical protein
MPPPLDETLRSRSLPGGPTRRIVNLSVVQGGELVLRCDRLANADGTCGANAA